MSPATPVPATRTTAPDGRRTRAARAPGAGAGAGGADHRRAAPGPPREIIRGQATIAPIGLRWRLALAGAALGMLLAPGVYLSLVVLAVWHAGWRLLRIPALGEVAARGAVQEYVAWLAVSVAAVALLLKPLVAPRGPQAAAVAITRAQAPALVDFIERLFAAMAIPAPQRIELRCDATTRMRLHGRPLAALRGKTTLAIGAAMMAGLSVRQLAGLVAREAGRFAHRDVALAGGVVCGINDWLQRRALEPDAWDKTLRAWGKSSGSLAMMLAGAGGLAAAAPRGILWLLMQPTRRASGWAARRLEAHAERRQIAVAGSADFDADAERIGQLRSLWRAALITAAEADRMHMPDNLPALTLSSERRRAPGRRQDVFGPPEPEPAARALAPGIVASEAPASALLDDFERVCRDLTRLHYHAALGGEAPEARLVSTASIAAAKAAAERAERACGRYFAGEPLRTPVPAPPRPPQAPADATAALATLRSARAEMAQLTRAATEAEQSLWEVDRLHAQVAQAEALVAGGFRFAPAALGLSEATSEAVRWRRAEVQQMERAAVLAVTPFTRAASRRLRCGLDLLHAPGAERRIPDVIARRTRVARLWQSWRMTTRAMDAAYKLRIEAAIAAALVERLPSQWEKLETRRASETATAAVVRRLGAVAAALRDAYDPFGAGHDLLRDTLISTPGEDAEAMEVVEAARQSGERLERMYQRTIAELAEHAEVVERALGVR